MGKDLKRDEREAELTAMALDQPGREKLLDEFLVAFGYGDVERLRMCNSPLAIIAATLAKEFPVM